MKSAADRWANGAKWPAPLLRPSPDALLEMRISIYQSGYIRHHQRVISLYGKDKDKEDGELFFACTLIRILF
jgi:hypothetical protein